MSTDNRPSVDAVAWHISAEQYGRSLAGYTVEILAAVAAPGLAPLVPCPWRVGKLYHVVDVAAGQVLQNYFVPEKHRPRKAQQLADLACDAVASAVAAGVEWPGGEVDICEAVAHYWRLRLRHDATPVYVEVRQTPEGAWGPMVCVETPVPLGEWGAAGRHVGAMDQLLKRLALTGKPPGAGVEPPEEIVASLERRLAELHKGNNVIEEWLLCQGLPWKKHGQFYDRLKRAGLGMGDLKAWRPKSKPLRDMSRVLNKPN